jgi:hypothetical protein
MYNAASVRPVEGLRGASSKSETISSRRARPVLTLTASDPWCLDLDGDADIYPRRPGREGGRARAPIDRSTGGEHNTRQAALS